MGYRHARRERAELWLSCRASKERASKERAGKALTIRAAREGTDLRTQPGSNVKKVTLKPE